jgi:YVTN family beta-propeller protein
VRKRWRLAAVTVLGVALVLGAWARFGTRTPAARVEAVIAVGSRPAAALSVDDDGVWVSNDGDGSISRIDPSTNQVVATIHIGPPQCERCLGTVAQRDGTVWATSSSAPLSLMRIDPASNQLAASSELPIFPSAVLSAADGSLWLSSVLDGEVVRLDRRTGTVLARLAVPGARALAEGGGAIWATARTGKVDGHVARIDPSSDQVTGETHLPIQPAAATFVDQSLWIVDDGNGDLVRFDPTTSSIDERVHVGFKPTGLVAANGWLWVVSGASRAVPGPSLTQVNPRDGTVAGTIALGRGDAIGLAAGAKSLWVVNRDPDVVMRVGLAAPAPADDANLVLALTLGLIVAGGALLGVSRLRGGPSAAPLPHGALLAGLRHSAARRDGAIRSFPRR